MRGGDGGAGRVDPGDRDGSRRVDGRLLMVAGTQWIRAIGTGPAAWRGGD
jgi:hypothetical protein